MEFKWEICGHCGLMVRCPKCNNNCCNGGCGEVDGKPCDTCGEAYKVQDGEVPWELKQTDEYKRWSAEQAYRSKEIEEENT